jgi:hypothetical protein
LPARISNADLLRTQIGSTNGFSPKTTERLPSRSAPGAGEAIESSRSLLLYGAPTIKRPTAAEKDRSSPEHTPDPP